MVHFRLSESYHSISQHRILPTVWYFLLLICFLLGSVFSTPSLGVTIYPDGTFMVTEKDLGVIDPPYSLNGHLDGFAGKFYIEIDTESSNNGYNTCVNEYTQGPEYDTSELVANDGSLLRSLLSAHVFNKRLQNNGWAGSDYECLEILKKKLPIVRIILGMWGTDVWGSGSQGRYRMIASFTKDTNELPELPEVPALCESTITNMDFGSIKLGATGHEATSLIDVRCDKKSSITVTVNNGSDFHDHQSGFSTAFSQLPEIQSCTVCSVPITGTITSSPNAAGSYQWQVPVTISYE